MTTRISKLLLSLAAIAIGLTMAAAPSADAAQARKAKKKAVAQVSASASVSAKPRPKARASHWGTNLVPAGPLYNGPEYLGDDPDPNIRAELVRELSARYGGND